MTQRPPDHHNIVEDAWSEVVGGLHWLKSVFIGEFADHRPMSVLIADMLLSFFPGVVIVTSARDAVAVILRLANHPEKREELMEWVLLSACLIVIALPVAMAAGGAAAAGVGAIVGGIAGSELGAALRAMMLLLIKEASKLVEVVEFLQKFMKGDVLKFVRAVKFAKYEQALLQALNAMSGKLLEIVKSLRLHLESLRYFDAVKATIAQLAAWEKKFYDLQRDALRQIPRALAELDARLAMVIAQTGPKEAHTVAAGVQADKTAVAVPAKQRVRDTPGNVFASVADNVVAHGEQKATPSSGSSPSKSQSIPGTKAAEKPKPPAEPLKNKPEPPERQEQGANTKTQAVVDAVAAADKARITQLSNEALEAERAGNIELRDKKIGLAQDILRPYFPKKNSNETWDEVVKRLDVSSPKDGAVFWSGTANLAKETGKPDAARVFAEKIGGVTLETTPGGRIVDGWEEINVDYPWNQKDGSRPFASELWQGISTNYAQSAIGKVTLFRQPISYARTTLFGTILKKVNLSAVEGMGS
ncbi:hypothetical protein E7V67_005795 [[Empedobacter] haloabium]|uniref:Uncharacterized protein n=1 Tax=[Empedobacter] haloabium TaxID=592317 RepID=A0ABZ1UPY8_9BURK